MRFRTLDSWRGLCALWVAIFHFRVVSHVQDIEFFHHGSLAVEFFFVLSGFVITNAYGGGLTTGTDRVRFLIRRFGRLYPLHFVTFAIVLAMECLRWLVSQKAGHPVGGPLFQGVTSPGAIVPNLLLVQGWGFLPVFTWNVPSWSISVEFFVCLVFIAASFAQRRLPMLAALAGLGLIALVITRYGVPNRTESTTALARGVFGFFLGGLVRYAYGWWKVNRSTVPGWTEWLAVPILLAGPFVDFTPFSAPMFAIMVFIFAFEAGPISRVLNHSVMIGAGEVSYSLYLVHYSLVLSAFGAAAFLGRITHVNGAPYIDLSNRFVGDLAIVGYLGLLVGISILSYRWIETPGRLWFNRLSNHIPEAEKTVAAVVKPGQS